MLVTILWNGCVRYVGGDVKVQYKLQALVYDILPWRKVPESDARSHCVCQCVSVSVVCVRVSVSCVCACSVSVSAWASQCNSEFLRMCALKTIVIIVCAA